MASQLIPIVIAGGYGCKTDGNQITTPLLFALSASENDPDPEIIRLLLEKGADPLLGNKVSAFSFPLKIIATPSTALGRLFSRVFQGDIIYLFIYLLIYLFIFLVI